MEEGYQALANAIVEQAAKDYKAALSGMKVKPACEAMKENVRKLEEFFSSDWYMQLTKVDGNSILERLRKEVDI